jgi:prepilin-type N-terminal cleavage/methylation domain-containing protein/prepilin-type processing-associated H-X9-DG protein
MIRVPWWSASMHRALSLRSRRGFTLVELLVVIAIIGVLVALLLPAVQSAREAARRMSCTNALKQIGIALHNHHDVRNALPPGAVNTGGNGTDCFATWAIEILPFMEQQSLYQRYDQTKMNTNTVNRPVLQSRVTSYDCPSDFRKGKMEVPASGPANAANIPLMHGSYRAVSGRTDITKSWARWDTFEPDKWSGGVHNKMYKGPLHATGMPYNGATFSPVVVAGQSITTLGGPERMADITDGTSNSLMVGELTFIDKIPLAGSNRATFWAYAYASYNQSSVTVESRTLTNSYQKCANAPGLWADQTCKAAFGSNHGTGLNFVFCDGSVRLVSYNVDILFLANTATIQGGENITIQSQQ